jgi:hypothetical protein
MMPTNFNALHSLTDDVFSSASTIINTVHRLTDLNVRPSAAVNLLRGGSFPEAVLRDLSWRKQVPALLRSRANSALALAVSSRFPNKTRTFPPMECL